MLHTEVILNLGLSFVTAILVFGFFLWQNARKYNTLPGNLGFPIIGNAVLCLWNYWHTTYSDFYKYLNKNADKYGDICCFWYCHKVAVCVSHPAIFEILEDSPNLYSKPPFSFERIQYFLKGIFSLTKTDEEWKMRRKEMVSRMKKDSLDDFRDIFLRTSKKAVKLWSEKKEGFDAKPNVTLLFLENTCATHFGIDVDLTNEMSLYKEVYMTGLLNTNNIANPITGYLSILLAGIFYPRTQQKFENMIMNETVRRAKEYMKAGSDQPTNIATAIAIRNLSKKTSRADLERELKELLYVSTHTMSYSGGTILMFLATLPEVQEKLWQEQQDIFGDSDRDPTHDDYKKMDYLDRFFKETLRFISPPINVREASGPIDIGGMIIPEGTPVFVNFQRMKFDSRYWKNPMEFNPDRFIDVKIDKKSKGIYIPYGYGARNCPGSIYANWFAKVFISTIVRNFKFHTKTKFEDLQFDDNIVRDIKGECNISLEKRVRRVSISQ